MPVPRFLTTLQDPFLKNLSFSSCDGFVLRVNANSKEETLLT